MKKRSVCRTFFSVVTRETTNTANALTDTSRAASSWSTNLYSPQYLDVFRENRAASTLSGIDIVSLLNSKSTLRTLTSTSSHQGLLAKTVLLSFDIFKIALIYY